MFKTNLKIILMFAVMLIFGFTAFISCEKESDILFNNSNIDSDFHKENNINFKPNDFYYVGEIHNKGLDYIYSEFKNVRMNNIQSMLQDINELTKKFFVQELGFEDSLVTFYCDSSFLDYAYFYSKTDFKYYWEYSFSIIHFTVDEQKGLLFSLFQEADKAENPTELSQLIDNYNIQAEKTLLDTIALKEFYMCTAVLKYSANYWYNYSDKWNALFETKASEGWFNWNSVARTDAASFVGGAIAGGAGAIGSGVGAPAALGIAVRVGSTAAVSGSAVDATVQLWDRVFGKP
jgi:hypothetical protein